jgi:hypothetical protein
MPKKKSTIFVAYAKFEQLRGGFDERTMMFGVGRDSGNSEY